MIPQPEQLADIFRDPDYAAKYAEGPRKFIPGFDGLHRIMAQMLLEANPQSVLVLGGGGGLETRTLMDALPQARFCVVDPSAEMIAQGQGHLGDTDRVDWVEGYIFDAPQDPFEAATCMLTLHFVPDDGGKLETLQALRARLKPGAPFFAAHLAIDKTAPDADRQFERYARFVELGGMEPDMVVCARTQVKAKLNCVSPHRDEELLREAGFSGVEMVYRGLYWCGWVAYA